MFQFLRDARFYCCIIYCQLYIDIRVFMNHRQKLFTNRKVNSQFLSALSDKRIFFSFARFDFTAYKLP